MNREQIAKFFGEEWVDFMVPFVQSDDFKAILNQLKADKTAGKTILPEQKLLFRCFQEVPLSKVRVIILGMDPYPTEGYANGIAFAHPMTKKVAPSLEKMIDAIETDCFSGLKLDKEKFDTELKGWLEQGILLLNTSLTITSEEPGGKMVPGKHADLWRPFIAYVIDTLVKVRRDLVFLAWGKQAQQFVEKIHFVRHFTFTAEHPAAAARAQKPWDCKHFSLTNAVIIGNKLGEPVKWA